MKRALLLAILLGLTAVLLAPPAPAEVPAEDRAEDGANGGEGTNATMGKDIAPLSWNVTGDEVRADGDETVTGSVVINSGESLTLRNYTLTFDPAGDQNCHLIVEAGGSLVMEDSAITSSSLDKGIVIKVYGGIEAEGSSFEHLGGEWVNAYMFGGLWLYSDDNDIVDCTFTRSIYGITAQGVEPYVRNCTFEGNYIGLFGSNAALEGVRGNLFTGNDHGLYAQDCALDLEGNTYNLNTGGIYLKRVSGTVRNEDYVGNYLGLNMDRGADFLVKGCTFTNNTAIGAPVHASAVSFVNCEFDLNQDGIYATDTDLTVEGCTFTRNQYKDPGFMQGLRDAMEEGMDLELEEDLDNDTYTCGASVGTCSTPDVHGAGIYGTISELIVANSTFEGNGVGMKAVSSEVDIRGSEFNDGTLLPWIALDENGVFIPDASQCAEASGDTGYFEPGGTRGGLGGGRTTRERPVLNPDALNNMDGWGFGLALIRCEGSLANLTAIGNPYGGYYLDDSDLTAERPITRSWNGLLGVLHVNDQTEISGTTPKETYDQVWVFKVQLNVVDTYGDRVSHAEVSLTSDSRNWRYIQNTSYITSGRGTAEIAMVAGLIDYPYISANITYTAGVEKDGLTSKTEVVLDHYSDIQDILEFVLDIPKSDLVIERISTGDSAVKGKKVTVEVVVRNDGDADSENTTVQVLWEKEDGTSRVIGTEDVPPLAPGAETSFEVEFEPDETGDLTISARVDPAGTLDEGDKDNNEAGVELEVEEEGEEPTLSPLSILLAVAAVVLIILLIAVRGRRKD